MKQSTHLDNQTRMTNKQERQPTNQPTNQTKKIDNRTKQTVTNKHNKQTNKQIDKQTDRQTQDKTNKQTDKTRKTNKQTKQTTGLQKNILHYLQLLQHGQIEWQAFLHLLWELSIPWFLAMKHGKLEERNNK